MYAEEQGQPKQDDQNYQEVNDEESEDEKDAECTNVPALVICVIFVAVMLGFVIYCGKNADFELLKLPTDDCGNVCGEMNVGSFVPVSQNCTAQDMRKYPKLVKTISKTSKIKRNKCVEKCPDNYTETLNRCVKPGQTFTDIQQTRQSFADSWYLIMIVCFVAFVFSYMCLLLYRYYAKYVIWIINIGFIIFTVALGSFFLFIMKDMKTGLLIYLLSLISIIVLIIFRKEIALVAAIFKESSKALMDVPAIMFEPILTFIALLVSFVAFILFIILIQAAAMTNFKDEKYSSVLLATHILNTIGFIWFTQFIFGCQHFIIAGTVSKWYFSRDKSKLDSPICSSFRQLTRFHLGSICLGSMLITLVKILKMIVNAIKKSIEKDSESSVAVFLACLCSCIVDMLDKALQYLVRNAYIIIALDGTPFFESGKRAFHLLKDNLDHCYSVNQFGDIVLAVCRFLVTLIAGFVAYEILKRPGLEDPMFFPLLVAIIFAFFIAHCFVTVFEMTVDTVFICYCIDIEENDGEENPYYMSDKLRSVMMGMENPNDGNSEDDDGNNMAMQPQPYPGQPMPDQQPYYPDQPSYPGQQPGNQDPGYSGPQQPYPGPQQPYPDPNQQPFYPQQPGYPGQQPAYSGQQPQYPVQQPQYPGQGPMYPNISDQNPSYPPMSGPDSTNPPQPYPPQPYPGQYPGQQPPYPGQQPPYPGQQPQFPAQQPQYPGQAPYPDQPPYSVPSMPQQQPFCQVNYPQAQAGYPPQQGYGPGPTYPQQPPY
ncbi:hypothetical protein ACKWTF_014619 [Chironomus riparius]